MLNRKTVLLLLGLAVLSVSKPSLSHEIFTSYTTAKVANRSFEVTFLFDVTDLQQLFQLDPDRDGNVTVPELNRSLDEIQAYLTERIKLVASGEDIILQGADVRVEPDSLGNVFVKLALMQELNFEPWNLRIEFDLFEDFHPRHKNLAKVVNLDEVQQFIFTYHTNAHTFSFQKDNRATLTYIGQFLWLGIEHIFIGYDHILFLLGLIVISGKFRNLVKMVTAFTAAHSITLILAALEVVNIPSRLVESVIALSIVYIAVENFLIKNSDERWIITFVFGLMHGFGFAGVLGELGLPTGGLVSSLLSFNLGVEIGQIAIVGLMFPLVKYANKTRWQKQFVYGISSAILVLGLVWFIERAFDLDLPLL